MCTVLSWTVIKLEEIGCCCFSPYNLLSSSSVKVPLQHRYLLAYRIRSQWCWWSLNVLIPLDQICIDRMGLSASIRALRTDFIWPLHVKVGLITFTHSLILHLLEAHLEYKFLQDTRVWWHIFGVPWPPESHLRNLIYLIYMLRGRRSQYFRINQYC